MGITTRISTATFTNFVDQAVPHLALSVGYWLLGADEANSKLNRSPNATVANATIVGTPIYTAGTMALTESAYIDTGEIITTNPDEWTMLSVASASVDTYCGTWYGAVNDAMLYNNSANSFKMTVGGSGSGIPAITDDTGSSIRFMAGVKTGTQTGTTYLHNGTSMQTQTGVGATTIATPQSYIIGPFGGAAASGSTQFHSANMLFDSALTATQIDDLYDYFSNLLSTRSVALL